MFHTKKFATILGLSALMLSPVLPAFHLTGADAAFAEKGGNGGGKGGGNGGGGNRGGGQSSESRTASAGSAETATRSNASSLGNMNGALHASPKAVLAHIRNGNTNGPVGQLAGLVAADAGVIAAEATAAALAEAADAWSTYNGQVTEALADSPYADAGLAAYETDLAAYNEWVSLGSAGDPPATLDSQPFVEITDATALIGAEPTVAEPTAEELAAAEQAAIDAKAAVTDAEAAILESWNKSGGTLSDADLLEQLRARFSPEDLEAIAASL